MEEIKAFIDESGDNALELNTEGIQSLFISVAIIVPESEYTSLNEEILRIIQRKAGGHLKSSNIRKDYQRRLSILQELDSINYKYYAFVVDKEKIFKDSGLAHKKSFYKFINRKVYEKISSCGGNLSIYADEIGRKDFMDSFVEYFDKKQVPNLFFSWDHRFVKDEEYPLIQLADFIAGTLSYCFEPVRKSEYSPIFRQHLKTKEIDIDFWPPVLDIPPVVGNARSPFDKLISEYTFKLAVKDILELSSSSVERDQILARILRILLFNKVHEENIFITAEGLENQLSSDDIKVSKNQISRDLIPTLRDRGHVISGTVSGVRLATTESEIKEYVNFDHNLVIPVLGRLERARKKIKMLTSGNLDIVDQKDYKQLFDILENIHFS